MKNTIKKIEYLFFAMLYVAITFFAAVSLGDFTNFIANKEQFYLYNSNRDITEVTAVIVLWIFLTTYIIAKYNREKHNKSKYLYALIPLISFLTILSYFWIS